MPFNDIYRLRVYQACHGAQVVNVMHFVQDDPIPTRGALELAQDYLTNMSTSMRGRASQNVSFQYVEVQSIVPFVGGPAIVNFPGGTTGSVSGSAVSATLAEVITIYSQRGGRRGRGRLFLPPPETSGASASGGLWLPAQTTKTTAFAVALAARYIDATKPIGWALGVWSKASGPQFPPWTTSQFARATGLTVRTTIRTQRRRQVGVGR